MILKRFNTIVLWLLAGAALAILLSCSLPLAAGGRALTVLSGSMSPHINTGDIVVALPEKPENAEVGEVVAFHNPEQNQRLTSHRIQSVQKKEGDFYFVTRGDANTSTESWSVPQSGSIGHIIYRLPFLGYLVFGLGSLQARIALVVLVTLIVFAVAMKRIWRPEGDPV